MRRWGTGRGWSVATTGATTKGRVQSTAVLTCICILYRYLRAAHNHTMTLVSFTTMAMTDGGG